MSPGPALDSGGTTLVLALALAYLGLGLALSWDLGRHGHGLGVRVSALACWPLLLGLRGRPAGPPSARVYPPNPGRGPHAARIDACLRALAASLDETAELGSGALDAEQLARLGEALDRADRRLARIDALLGETAAERGQLDDPALDALLETLRAARDHAQRELDGILAGLVQLRVQLGLASLADEGERVRERVAELEARVAALTDLASDELGKVRS